ncbi:rhythmically expressed gene 2 protein-like [Toxorhynchites rutilus septentrionalis]|uniref:rhythmically expressed gene 2 protein-like n=1 Tax=Toxorhynchites rutilus septentrionalis TaxID=329112 RepID=UPI0024796948|nr:rhythmically expressed gene 2 protein-like [Toxorhynchites rutilus septentrionalis]
MINTGSHLVAKNLARFKLITFDVTDTLLKFSRPPEMQYALAAKRHGCTDLNEPALAKCFRSNFKRMAREYPNFGKCSTYDWQWWWRTLVMDIFRESHAHLDHERLNRIADDLIEDFKTSDCWTKTEMADEILETARVHCKHVGIISNFDPRLRDIIGVMNLPTVDFIVTSYEVGDQKPGGKIFEHALSLCNSRVLPCEALHVGNTPHLDYMGAKQAGWSSVLVNIDSASEKGVSLDPEINPKHVFRNFSEFIHVLKTVELKW